jgi:hypothetical protein
MTRAHPQQEANFRQQFLAKAIAVPPVIDITIPPAWNFNPTYPIGNYHAVIIHPGI